MDNPDAPKARRPLPTPGAAAITPPRPSTPIQRPAQRAIEASTFYGAGTSSSLKAAPPLPSRARTGSSLATSHTPVAGPPRYDSNPPGYREPELIIDEEPMDDSLPGLISQDTDNNGWGVTGGNGWDTTSSWNSNWGEPAAPTSTFDSLDILASKQDSDLPIDGRVDREELNWWNAEERARAKRPGPGVLAPVLADKLHNPHHNLYSVNILGTPEPAPQNPPSTARPDQSSTASSFALSPPQPPHSAVPLSTSPSLGSSSSSSRDQHPTEDEIRTAVPHPNAYYCPRENGWVILTWKSSSVPPPISDSYESEFPLPDQARRRQTTNCLDKERTAYDCGNKTHHFHLYPKAINSLNLSPPYQEDFWNAAETTKLKNRSKTVVDDIDRLQSEIAEEVREEVSQSKKSKGILLDLYMCCQCGLYCTVSPLIPGVVPRKHLDELRRDKINNPPPGKTGEACLATSIDTLLVAIENKMFKGNNRLIKINSSGFRSKLGWSDTVKAIFMSLGFRESSNTGDLTLMSPHTEIKETIGMMNRRRVLRGWVELGAWLQELKQVHRQALKDFTGQKTWLQIDNAREMYQNAIGAHPDQIPRQDMNSDVLAAVRNLHDEWSGLGLTPISYSPELLAFAYLSQCRCDPAGTPRYFTYLSAIVSALVNSGNCPPQLQELLVMEQSRNRFTLTDIETAARNLGFGATGDLALEYDEKEIDDQFLENAWRSIVKRSWMEPGNSAEIHRNANDAFRVLAESRGSARLINILENEKNKMTPEQAYNTLEVPKETDDMMLITVYSMRIEETTLQLDKMREAMAVIAETRDSERLREFLKTGVDPGEITVPIRADLPRGLNQLGNTCYLNSLLQYFYTIKDLRDAVTPMAHLDLKNIEESKLSDDAISKHRVGGRLITRREIVRSRKFISQLARLFSDLEFSEVAAVTPEIELAKLALVTSRDEEEDEADKGGSDSSNDTDATLVDGSGPHVSASSESVPQRSSSASVLGKRARDLDRQKSQKSAMEVDDDGYVLVSSPPRTGDSPQSMSERDRQSPMKGLLDRDGDVSMKATTPAPEGPPPPPPRKVESIDSGGMMFGRQHDVAECMDNCMFQIETALLKFDNIDEDEMERTSVVKRLFYGKIRQRLTGVVPNSRSSIHEKEDLFSHLPVNVINEGNDIYDGLSGYFDDVVEWEGSKARMEVSLVDAPPLLQIQLQRVQFNRETLQPYKSQAYVKFGETIYLDRFMDNVDPHKKYRSRNLQRQLNECRERIRILLEGKNGSFMSTLEHTSKFLGTVKDKGLPGVEIEDRLVTSLRDEQSRVQQEIDQLREFADSLKEQLEELWKDSKDYPYELTSVFIHRGGSPSWGHYFFYSRNLPEKPDSWFKYNDSDVTVVPKEEVLQDTTGSTANPYLLVFARKGSNVVKTVNRFVLDADDA